MCVYMYIYIHMYVYATFFIHSFTGEERLFLCLCYCKQCCSAHGSADISEVVISFPCDLYPRSGLLGHIVSYIFNFLRKLYMFHNG